MTNEKAKDVLLNYTCCCKYGTSPINCSDEECDFGKAIKTLCNRPQNKWVKIFENDFVNGYVCPFCGHKIQVTEQFLPEVTECEACGADMRGGAE